MKDGEKKSNFRKEKYNECVNGKMQEAKKKETVGNKGPKRYKKYKTITRVKR